jgi:fucose 4-O-acetylase-like acetyltransferase
MRQNYLDILKGISIISIVLLHFEDGIFPPFLNIAIGTFMIVAFFFVSGWLMDASCKERTVKEHLKKRWKTLCIPYLWFSLVFILFDIILYFLDVFDRKYILREIYKTLTLRGIGTLWFIPALLGGEIIWIYLKKKNTVIRLSGLILTLIYINVYHSVFDGRTEDIWRIIDAPFRTISTVSVAWITIAIGYYIHRYCADSLLSLKYKTCAGILLITIGFFLNNFGWFPSFGIMLFVYPIFSYTGIMLLVIPCQNSFICRYFEYWGRNSLILMLTHYTIIMELFILLNNSITNTSDNELHGAAALFYFALTMIVEYYVVILINKYFPFLIGKQKTSISR